MLENLAVMALASFLSLGSYTYSLTPPPPPPVTVISPLANAKELPTPTPTLTPTPTATPTPTPPPPTATPTPFPTAMPTPTPQPIVTSSDLETLFNQYSSQYNVDSQLLKKIAQCESGFNTNAAFLDYGGMFQFSSSSWSSTRVAMGQDPNPELRFNAEEAIKTAAYKISQNGVSAWPNCH